MKDLEIKQKPEESSEALIAQDKISKTILFNEKGRWIPGQTANLGGYPKKSDWGKDIREY